MEFLRFVTASVVMLLLFSFDYSGKKKEGTVVEQQNKCMEQVKALREANEELRDSLQVYRKKADSLTVSLKEIKMQCFILSGDISSANVPPKVSEKALVKASGINKIKNE